MDSSLSPSQGDAVSSTLPRYNARGAAEAAKAQIVSVTLGSSKSDKASDKVDVSLGNLSKGLSITAQSILERINELLEKPLTAETDRSDHTPEKTAERIVQGVTLLFGRFARQNPGLEGHELIEEFMKRARQGVESGYSDAYQTLDGLDAFSVEGVKNGVTETKRLIDEKLTAFEEFKRQELGLSDEEVETSLASSVKSDVLKAGGIRLVA